VDRAEGRDSVALRLANWRDPAFGLYGLIFDHKRAPAELIDELLSSAKAAADLRGGLPEDAAQLRRVTKEVRTMASRVSGQLATLQQQLRYEVGEDD
jgi:hypothetical protein